jgi:probable phosphoglycerate mutase
MAIFLVRHGETPSNRERIMQLENTPLSEQGMQQAERLAQRLCALGVTRILCSDLLRARQTAEPVARLTQAPLQLTPLLRERDFGDLRGTPYHALTSDPFAPDFVPPRGESWEVFHARVARAFAQVGETRRLLEGNLVVITHGLVLRALVQHHLPWPASAGEAPRHFLNTSVTQLSALAPHSPSLVNCCAHLSAPGAATC